METLTLVLGAVTTFVVAVGAAWMAYLKGRQGISAENSRLQVELTAARQKIADDAADRKAKRSTDKVVRVSELQKQYTLLAVEMRQEIKSLRERLDAAERREAECQVMLEEARQHHADCSRLVADLEARLLALERK